jgi:hypothetical protein
MRLPSPICFIRGFDDVPGEVGGWEGAPRADPPQRGRPFPIAKNHER